MKILLIGGGGHCKSVLSSMLAKKIIPAGIIDKDVGKKILGVPIIGNDDKLAEFADMDYEFIIAIGGASVNLKRMELFDMAKRAYLMPATFIAESAILKCHPLIGQGTVVLDGAIINAGVEIGRNCIVNTGAIIEHDVIIGDGAMVSPGAIVCGGVKIGNEAFIGVGAVIIQGIRIGDRSTIGAGAIVINDVRNGVTVVGNPARAIQEVNHADDTG